MSKMFRNQLFGKLAATNCHIKNGVTKVKISDFSYPAYDAMIKLMYTSQRDIVAEVKDLEQLSDFFTCLTVSH